MATTEKFYVDDAGWIHSTTTGPLRVNMFHHNDSLLLRGRFERSGFGMTEREASSSLSRFV